jgi:hypothetical protein
MHELPRRLVLACDMCWPSDQPKALCVHACLAGSCPVSGAEPRNVFELSTAGSAAECVSLPLCLLLCLLQSTGGEAEQQHSSPLDKLQQQHDLYAQQIEQIRQELQGAL